MSRPSLSTSVFLALGAGLFFGTTANITGQMAAAVIAERPRD